MAHRKSKKNDRFADFGCCILFFVLISLLFLLVITLFMDLSRTNTVVRKLEMASEFPRIQISGQINHSSPAYFSIGTARAPRGNREMEGRVYLSWIDGNQSSMLDNKITACHNPFGEGVIWKHGEPYILDHSNNQGLSKEFFYNANMRGMYAWSSHLVFMLFGNLDEISIADGPDLNAPDGKNEIQFGFIDQNGVLAFTVVWGVFSGPIEDREIYEADILYNLKFQWGNASLETGVLDLTNIAAHEFGHYVGEGHIGNPEATMYPSAATDEIKKRDLLECEIGGLCLLYNENTCPGLNGTEVLPFVPFNGASRIGSWLPVVLLICAVIL